MKQKIILSIKILTVVVVLFAGAHYVTAVPVPGCTPSEGCNTDGPIGGDEAQTKKGSLTLNRSLWINGFAADGTTPLDTGLVVEKGRLLIGTNSISESSPLKVLVNGKIAADRFCDTNGSNCIIPSSTTALADRSVVAFDLPSCPAGWNDYIPAEGRKIIGAGTSTEGIMYYLREKKGEEKHTLTVQEMATHRHTVSFTDPGHTHTYTGRSGNNAGGNDKTDTIYFGSSMDTYSSPIGIGTNAKLSLGATGGGQPMNVMNPYVALKYCIKGTYNPIDYSDLVFTVTVGSSSQAIQYTAFEDYNNPQNATNTPSPYPTMTRGTNVKFKWVVKPGTMTSCKSYKTGPQATVPTTLWANNAVKSIDGGETVPTGTFGTKPTGYGYYTNEFRLTCVGVDGKNHSVAVILNGFY